MTTFTVRSGERLLYAELTKEQLVDVLKAGLLDDGTELFKNKRMETTYVIRNGRLETWKGRVVADSSGVLKHPKIIPNLER